MDLIQFFLTVAASILLGVAGYMAGEYQLRWALFWLGVAAGVAFFSGVLVLTR